MRILTKHLQILLDIYSLTDKDNKTVIPSVNIKVKNTDTGSKLLLEGRGGCVYSRILATTNYKVGKGIRIGNIISIIGGKVGAKTWKSMLESFSQTDMLSLIRDGSTIIIRNRKGIEVTVPSIIDGFDSDFMLGSGLNTIRDGIDSLKNNKEVDSIYGDEVTHKVVMNSQQINKILNSATATDFLLVFPVIFGEKGWSTYTGYLDLKTIDMKDRKYDKIFKADGESSFVFADDIIILKKLPFDRYTIHIGGNMASVLKANKTWDSDDKKLSVKSTYILSHSQMSVVKVRERQKHSGRRKKLNKKKTE